MCHAVCHGRVTGSVSDAVGTGQEQQKGFPHGHFPRLGVGFQGVPFGVCHAEGKVSGRNAVTHGAIGVMEAGREGFTDEGVDGAPCVA
jgi:hypothetical protein